jgi:hypothetical protein
MFVQIACSVSDCGGDQSSKAQIGQARMCDQRTGKKRHRV